MFRFVQFFKTKERYQGIARYVLGLGMLPYAITKLLRTQFVVFPFAMWQQPLEKLSGITLTWAFLGYSPWFQVVLGVFELIPSILLLFCKTRLAGGLLMLPMTIGVFLVNHALNLWQGTKMVATIFLLLNLIVLACEWKKMQEILNIVLEGSRQRRSSLIEFTINVVMVAGLVFYTVPHLTNYLKEENELTGDWYHHHAFEWRLDTEKVNDSLRPPRTLKAYFGAPANILK